MIVKLSYYEHLQKFILDRSLSLFQELHTIRMELKWDGFWNSHFCKWWCWVIFLVLKIQPWPELSALTSARCGPSTSHGGWSWRAFWKTQRVKSFLVPLLTCKSLPQQHFEGQAASYWDRRRALRAKEPWKGPEQDLATNKFSFYKNCVHCIVLFYLQWVWHKAIKISKKLTVNLIKVGVIENYHQLNGCRLPHFLKTFMNSSPGFPFGKVCLQCRLGPVQTFENNNHFKYNLCQGY